MPPARIVAIHRYPVKGLSPEPLSHTRLARADTLPADRRYAIENGPIGFRPEAPAYVPKSRFLMLMRNERLARLRSRYEEDTHLLTIREGDREVARGRLDDAAGRATIEAFFADYCATELRGPPKILTAPGFSFSDVAAKVVSIINLASVAALAQIIGAPVDPLRFRGNLHIEGWPAFGELDLLEGELTIGSARLKVVKRIQRCAATNVDPSTGVRDMRIPETLMQAFGHRDCGVYAQVLSGGVIRNGDAVVLL